MRIKTQFIVTMLLFAIILVVAAASAIMTHRQVEDTGEQERIAAGIAQGASELGYLSNDYLIYRESQQLARWHSRFAAFSGQVAVLQPDTQEQQALVANIRANKDRMKAVFDSMSSVPGPPHGNRGTVLDPAFLQVSWSRMAVQTQALAADASRLSQLLHQEMDRLESTRTLLMYMMVGLFGAFLLASYLLTYRRILTSIATLRAGAAVIGSGNLDFAIEEKTNDEIGELSRAFNRMTTDLKAVTASKADLEREIDERKRVEAEMQKLAEQHQLALDAARMGWWHYDPITRIASWDDRFIEIFGVTGYSRPEDEILARLHPEDLPGVWAKAEAALGPVNPHVFSAEYRINLPGGSMKWIETHGIASFEGVGENRRVRSFVGTVQDITERKRTEATLTEHAAKLEEINKELESFSYSVSHDLRAPLRAIAGFSQMILKKEGERFDEETRRRFQVIRDNAETMGRLIDDLLAFSRLGRQAIAKSRTRHGGADRGGLGGTRHDQSRPGAEPEDRPDAGGFGRPDADPAGLQQPAGKCSQVHPGKGCRRNRSGELRQGQRAGLLCPGQRRRLRYEVLQ